MLVFVDRGQGKLLPRYVEVGRSFTTFNGRQEESYYQVINGLKEGERVVASANFLIDAESQVQGALKDWQEEQPTATPGMTESRPNRSLNSNFDASLKLVLDSYKKLRELLSENKFEPIPAEAQALRKRIDALAESKPSSGQEERYMELLRKLDGSADQFEPNDISDARIEFGQLSADLIAFVKDFTPEQGDPLYVIKCPMWKKSPAAWLQDSTQIANPFLGPDMPTCGTIQETLQVNR
jgi:hypothetical protein